MRRPARIVGSLLLVLVGACSFIFWTIKRQGVPSELSSSIFPATVKFDKFGIPTVEGPSWSQIVEARGYVVASERMWQMDLLRRRASGRLSEWFGEATLSVDKKTRLEGWGRAAARSLDLLPKDEREACEAYARGVNRFIANATGYWGIEYTILNEKPEPWRCIDSLYAVLNMAEELSSSARHEADQSIWRDRLSDEWAQFLFPVNHPWNKPLFGSSPPTAAVPSMKSFLPSTPLRMVKPDYPANHSQSIPGSNSWAWHGATGSYLANDPHLGASVPQLWYAMRLRLSSSDWVVGVAVPGAPGVVLGMNPYLAWSFTNVCEDVDDYLLETLSADGTKYLASEARGQAVWKDVESEETVIKVRGAPDHVLQVRRTHRGPLIEVPALGSGLYSRQWLALKDGMLRIPTLKLGAAKDWAQFNQAADSLSVPAQNAIVVDRAGNIGYRATGTGIRRRVSGRWPQPGVAGEWVGFSKANERPRKWIPAKGQQPTFLASANERIWVDKFSHPWAGDLRKERIQRYLQQRSDFSRNDMEKLQLDTESRFHQELVSWIALHAVSSNTMQTEVADMLRRWDGNAIKNPLLFTLALKVEELFVGTLLGRVRDHYLPEHENPIYFWTNRSAWVLSVITSREATSAFGLTDEQLASFLLAHLAKHRSDPSFASYERRNSWRTQHPFVGRLPLQLGDLWRVREAPQNGNPDLVRVERPNFGASVRIVWDLGRPSESIWSFPVGQSGHLASRHFRDLQEIWILGDRIPVFDADLDWKFAPVAPAG